MMTEPSIEEAWAALKREEAECHHERSGAEGRDHVASTAKALALAVLEAAVAEFERHGHAQVDHLRRRIKELT